jgi:hypothetical protein
MTVLKASTPETPGRQQKQEHCSSKIDGTEGTSVTATVGHKQNWSTRGTLATEGHRKRGA